MSSSCQSVDPVAHDGAQGAQNPAPVSAPNAPQRAVSGQVGGQARKATGRTAEGDYIRRDAPVLTEDEVRRFWSKVQKSDGCWLWAGAVGSNGYGVLQVGRKPAARMLRATRLALFLATGEWHPDRLACHTCDVPLCVRPDHLYYGTKTDNARDSVERGATHQRIAGRKRDMQAFPMLVAALTRIATRPLEGDPADDANESRYIAKAALAALEEA